MGLKNGGDVMKIVVRLSLILLAGSSIWGQELRQRPQYTLRPGDIVELQYRYTPELNETVTVLPDGYVNLNLIGNVKVTDLTMEQAHDLIVQKAGTRLNDPDLNLILREFQRPYIVVAGEVGSPGKIDLRENTTALQAILLAGGFKESAHSGQVLLFRKINADTAEVKILKLTNIHSTAQLEQDTQLEAGDMLLVPRNKIEKISRYIKAFNVGMFINPLQVLP
jgi:polysaccharide biosynthesis/export protein